MKGSRFVPVTIVLAVLLALSAGLTAAQGPTPQDQAGPQASVDTAFTYQGQLQKDGALVNDTCTMVFSLYDDAAAGSRQGSPITLTVAVADGLFTAVLNSNGEFGTDAFTGDARWLEVAVQCPGDAGFSTLTPRQALTATPYALSLRPGAIVEGQTAGTVLSIRNEGEGDGLSGRSASTHGRGVYGWVTATSGDTHGVEGTSASTAGVGVFGRATATTGNTIGLSGQVDSPDGTAVYGRATATTGNTYGVYGQSNSPDGTGVYGWATATTGNSIGVLGYTSSVSGTTFGVYGANYTARGAGVFGRSNYTTPPPSGGAGVFGRSDPNQPPGSGYGVYGEAFGVNAFGAFGYNTAGYGVGGYTDSGTGVYGTAGAAGTAIYGFGGGTAIRGESWGGLPLFLSQWEGDYLIQATELPTGSMRFEVTAAGDVYADGGYYSPAPGYAEMLPGADGLEAGDVLVVGPDGSLARCDTAFQPTVVGVYAPEAGVVTGKSRDAAGQVPLAVMGVVTVKVSAENGPIAPGDLLVAAATPGHAMRAGADPAMGTVIGKALGSLEKDTGTLLMLVMLR